MPLDPEYTVAGEIVLIEAVYKDGEWQRVHPGVEGVRLDDYWTAVPIVPEWGVIPTYWETTLEEHVRHRLTGRSALEVRYDPPRAMRSVPFGEAAPSEPPDYPGFILPGGTEEIPWVVYFSDEGIKYARAPWDYRLRKV